MDIGKEVKEYEFEPVPVGAPVHEPAPVLPTEPAPEPVPVGFTSVSV